MLNSTQMGITLHFLLALGSIVTAERDAENTNQDRGCPPMKFISRGESPRDMPAYYYAVLDSEPYVGDKSEVHTFYSKYAEPKTGCKFGLDEPCIIGTGLSICREGLECKNLNDKPTPSFEEVDGGADLSVPMTKTRHPAIGICRCPSGTRLNTNSTGCVKAAKFGARCNDKLPCEGVNVECFKNRCGCPPIKSFTRPQGSSNYTYGIRDLTTYDGNLNELQEHAQIYNANERRCMSREGGVCSHVSSEWIKVCPRNESCWTSYPTFTDSNSEYVTVERERYADNTTRYPLLGTCNCEESQIRDPKTNKCNPRPSYGEACTANDCLGEGISCEDGRCACLKASSIFDAKRKKCVIELDATCFGDYGESCIAHAECKYYSYSSEPRKCTCQDGYEAINGSCVGRHLTKCGESSECNSQALLKCVDGFCKCKGSGNQFYDKWNSKCEGLVGAKCSGDNTCHGLAMCTDGVCKCTPRSVETPEGKCERMAGFGQDCSTYPCNYRNGLACIDGKCECFDSNYEAKNGVCLGSVGLRCGNVEQVGWNQDPDSNSNNRMKYYFISCEEGSTCMEVPDGKPRCKI